MRRYTPPTTRPPMLHPSFLPTHRLSNPSCTATSAHLKSTLVMCLCPPRRYRSDEKSELPHPITSTRSSRLTNGVTYSARSLYEPYLAGGDNRWEWWGQRLACMIVVKRE